MAHQQVRTPRPLLRILCCLAGSTMLLGIESATAAFAAPRKPIPPTAHNWGYSYGAQQPGSGAAPSASGHKGSSAGRGSSGHSGPGKMSICGVWRMGIQGCSAIPAPRAPADAPPAPEATPAQLAATAWQRLRLPVPQVATAPPRGSEGLVGLPEWFWVRNWGGHHNRVQAGGVWAEVTARPTSLTINPGAGQPAVTCHGPGIVYHRGRPAAEQDSDCSYTYRRSSAGLPDNAYRVTATVTWTGTWVGSDGSGGALPALSRSSTFAVRVAEGQAVTN